MQQFLSDLSLNRKQFTLTEIYNLMAEQLVANHFSVGSTM